MEMEPKIIDMNKNNFKEEEDLGYSYAAKLPYVFFSFDLNLNLDLITHAPRKNTFISVHLPYLLVNLSPTLLFIWSL